MAGYNTTVNTNKGTPIRTPIRRQRAEEYLLITMLSFALSVSVTRLFLYVTGYPQLGGGGLHIAHVLWGGLFLFVASLLPLLFANRWAFRLSALFSGIGVGLFIDEVGKFITSTNDYFFPWAAPIIYIFFLLTAALYMRVSRPKPSNFRSELYYALEDFQEVLDHDLSDQEKTDIIRHLENVRKQSENPSMSKLAINLEEYVHSSELEIVLERPTRWQAFLAWLEQLEKRHLNRNLYRAVLSGALLGLSAWSLYYPLVVFSAVIYERDLGPLLMRLVEEELVNSTMGINSYSVMLALELAAGLLMIIGAALLGVGRDRRGFSFLYFGLLFSLTVVNVLVFYFDQFSTIATSALQFGVLMLSLRYRQRFLSNVDTPPN